MLAAPPPHPSESLVSNPNPLVAAPGLPSSGIKLSLVTPAPNTLLSLQRPSIDDSEKSVQSKEAQLLRDAEDSSDKRSSSTEAKDNLHDTDTSSPPSFGGGNSALIISAGKDGKDASKKGKPKSNILKSNSTFVSKVLLHELLNRRVQEHREDGSYVIANFSRAIQWLDISSTLKVCMIGSIPMSEVSLIRSFETV